MQKKKRGRPSGSKTAQPTAAVVSLRLSAEQLAELDQLSALWRRSRADTIREAIRVALLETLNN